MEEAAERLLTQVVDARLVVGLGRLLPLLDQLGQLGPLAVAGERPPPSVAEWAARDDPGSSNAEQRFAQWKRVDEGLVTSGAAKSNAIYDAFGAVWKSTSELGSRRWRGAPEI